jgi:cystathionine beta-lyase/cystathionine gamma-synthase
MTHAAIPLAERQKLGIHDNFIRISVGIEALEDLKKDLDHAFASLALQHHTAQSS